MTSQETTAREPSGPRLYVDEALCCAHGQCVLVAPSLFELDDDGFNKAAGAGWVGLAPEQVESAVDAERSCPDAAIRVILR
jgi:ferredoxin